MNERIESLTMDRAVFHTNVQTAASRLSIPHYLCELYGWSNEGIEIDLRIERRGAVFHDRYSMSSGFEIVPKADDTLLRKVLKPGARVKVIVAP